MTSFPLLVKTQPTSRISVVGWNHVQDGCRWNSEIGYIAYGLFKDRSELELMTPVVGLEGISRGLS
ncbi:hypothetical protein GH733_006997, partial [Mirounga leonina]